MIGVVLVQAGLVTILLGGIGLFIRWRAGLVLLLIGPGLVVTGFFWPAPLRAVESSVTRLDAVLPAYQFFERHGTRVEASCERSYEAVRQVTAGEVGLFRLLTWIRRLGRPGPESILNAPERDPLIEVATRTGFLTLADEPGREIVIGTVVIMPTGGDRPETADSFHALDGPGYAKAAMTFRLDPVGREGCEVTTETRVYATDAASSRRFARYWRVIYPGSALIRRMWLRAIKRRAEAPIHDS